MDSFLSFRSIESLAYLAATIWVALVSTHTVLTMVSNFLSRRLRLSRPPVVCVSKPGTPADPLTFDIWVDDSTVCAYEGTGLHVYGDHPYYDEGVEYTIAWDPGSGYIDPPPSSHDEIKGSGWWTSSGVLGKTEIKAMATWPNGTKVYKSLFITVVACP